MLGRPPLDTPLDTVVDTLLRPPASPFPGRRRYGNTDPRLSS